MELLTHFLALKKVINAYFNILQRNCNDDKVAFATTHFMAKLLVDGDKYEYDATLKRFYSEASKQLSLNIFELNEKNLEEFYLEFFDNL
jgi:hypothetical protein